MSKLRRLFIIKGNDDLLRREAIDKCVKEQLPAFCAEFNYDRLDCAGLRPETLGRIASTPPMMADRRVLHLYDVDQLTKDSMQSLLDVLEEAIRRQGNGEEDVAFILVYAFGKSAPPSTAHLARKIEALAASLPIDCKPKQDDAPRWLIQRARQKYGYTLDPAVADELFNCLGDDAGQLATEFEKLRVLAGEGPITVEMVAWATGVQKGRSMNDLCDAVGNRQPDQALEIADSVLGHPDYTGVRVGIGLSTHMNSIGLVRSLMDTGLRGDGLARAASSVWKVQKIIAQAQRWTAAEIDAAMQSLLLMDHALKSGASDHEAIRNFIHNATGTGLPVATHR